MEYSKTSAMALRQIVEGEWWGTSPESTHDRRFALAELVRRAEAYEASVSAQKSPAKPPRVLPIDAPRFPSPERGDAT